MVVVMNSFTLDTQLICRLVVCEVFVLSLRRVEADQTAFQSRLVVPALN